MEGQFPHWYRVPMIIFNGVAISFTQKKATLSEATPASTNYTSHHDLNRPWIPYHSNAQSHRRNFSWISMVDDDDDGDDDDELQSAGP